MSATQRYFVLFTPVGWAVNDRDTANEYMLFGLGEDGYRLAKESADELNAVEFGAALSGGETDE